MDKDLQEHYSDLEFSQNLEMLIFRALIGWGDSDFMLLLLPSFTAVA